MSMSRKLQKKLFHKLLYSALALSILSTGTAYAEEGMPQGGAVVTATAPTGFSANPVSGATMTATANTLINWDSFNLGAGKTITLDPNGFVFMHQVTGASQSEIMGILNGGTSGHLILANPHGIIVEGATINADRLTLTTMQNLDATGFGKLTSGGWGPEITTNDALVGITNSTIGVKHYFGVLAGVIMLADHVTVNTENSTIDLTAVKNGQYSLLMGRDAFYSNGVQYTNASNSIKIGANTVLNVNGNSYNSIHILGGQVGIGDYALLNTGSDPNRSDVMVEAVATKNDSEADPSKRYTGSEANVIHMGLVSFTNGNFALIGGKLAGETESFQDKFKQVSGATPPTPPTPPEPDPPTPPTPPTPPEPDPPTPPTPPTPPEPDPPTPPTPPEPTPEPSTAEEMTAAINFLDAQRNNDAVKAAQEALQNTHQDKKVSGDPDHVNVQSGGDSPLDITKGLQPLTVSEAAARSRSAAKAYMKALRDGDKAKADQLKEALKEANRAVKILKEQEKLSKEEAAKTKDTTSTGQQPVNIKTLSDNDLLNRETALRDALRKAQTSEERQQIMRDLDAVHNEQTDRYKAAQQTTQYTEQPAQQQFSSQDLTKYEDSLKEAQDRLNKAMNGTDASELLRAQEAFDKAQNDLEKAQRGEQQSGITITSETPKDAAGPTWIDKTIGEKLLTREADARARLRRAQTPEESRQIMKELDEIHAEETKLVNDALKQQEQISIQQAAERTKAVGGEMLQKATDKANDTLNKAKEAQQRERDLKAKETAAHEKVRALVEQWNQEKAEGASKERLDQLKNDWEKAYKEWDDATLEWNNQLSEVDKANQEAKAAAKDYDRVQNIAKAYQNDQAKLETGKAELENMRKEVGEIFDKANEVRDKLDLTAEDRARQANANAEANKLIGNVETGSMLSAPEDYGLSRSDTLSEALDKQSSDPAGEKAALREKGIDPDKMTVGEAKQIFDNAEKIAQENREKEQAASKAYNDYAQQNQFEQKQAEVRDKDIDLQSEEQALKNKMSSVLDNPSMVSDAQKEAADARQQLVKAIEQSSFEESNFGAASADTREAVNAAAEQVNVANAIEKAARDVSNLSSKSTPEEVRTAVDNYDKAKTAQDAINNVDKLLDNTSKVMKDSTSTEAARERTLQALKNYKDAADAVGADITSKKLNDELNKWSGSAAYNKVMKK